MIRWWIPVLRIFVLSSASVAAGAPAAEQRLDLVLADSSVAFELGATLHTVDGAADLEEGWMVFDLETGLASGRLRVDAGSAVTGNANRDRRMHARVLESAAFGDIVFSPQAVEGELTADGRGSLRLGGTLGIHGVERPVEVEVKALGLEGETLRAEASFAVPYVEWGMTDPSTWLLRVAKMVTVRVQIAARLTPVGPPTPQPDEPPVDRSWSSGRDATGPHRR